MTTSLYYNGCQTLAPEREESCIKAKHKSTTARVELILHISCHFMFEKKNEAEGTRKTEDRRAEFLAASEACVAIFSPTPGLTESGNPLIV